jgi:hypothetical protein
MGGTSRPWPLWQRLLWVVLAVLVCWHESAAFLADLRPPRDHPRDFFQEWASARNYLTGLPIYLPQLESYRRHLGYDQPPPDLLPYNAHPPTLVLLALPFARLDYPDAVLVWNLLSLLALVVSVAWVVRGLRIPWSWWAVFPVVTLLMLCDPFRQQMIQGQLNLVLALLITAAWRDGRRGRDGRAGVWLGVATAVKLFPGFLLAHAAWRGRFRTAAAGTATVLLLTALTVGVLGTEAYRDYARVVLPGLQRYRNDATNLSVIGFWGKLCDPNNPWASEQDLLNEGGREQARTLSSWDRILPLYRSPTLARAGGLVSAAVVVLTLAWAVRPYRRLLDPDVAFALAVTAMLLVSPIVWNHYALLLLVPFGVLWVRLPRGPARLVFWAALFALWVNFRRVFNLVVPGGEAVGIIRPAQTLTVMSFQTYALLALFVLLLCEARRSLSPSSSSSG